MKVILNQQEVIEAVAQWLRQRGITAKHVAFEFVNVSQYVKELKTEVTVEKVEIHEGPYR